MKSKRRDAWKTPLIAALCVANAALGLSLVSDVLPIDGASPATAAMQVGRPSEYLMIPAQLTSANQEIIYIVDTQSGDLTAAAFQRNSGINFIAPLRLGQSFQNAGR